jgi:hypothetical protein
MKFQKLPLPDTGYLRRKKNNPLRNAAAKMPVGYCCEVTDIGAASRLCGFIKELGFKAASRSTGKGFRVWKLERGHK